MSMFPGPGAQVHYNEAGEPLGWDYPSYDEPDVGDTYDAWENDRYAISATCAAPRSGGRTTMTPGLSPARSATLSGRALRSPTGRGARMRP